MSHGHEGLETATYRRAVEAERAAKDAFFSSAPHSPLGASARREFRGLDYFPVDGSYRIAGLRLQPYSGDGTLTFEMPTSDGRSRAATRVGSFVFERGRVRQTLTAYSFPGTSGTSLFVPFRDATSGRETYGTGRYLDVEHGPDGDYVLDFNHAYHPYCAYSQHFSCPLTPDENRLWRRLCAQLIRRIVYVSHRGDRTGARLVTEPIVFIDLGVGGMTCDDCVVHVTKALESVRGVANATVDLASRSAVVRANPDVATEALAAAVHATGQYNAFERRRRPASDA
jgi:copper chaperone CopZ